jgi:hypothetical protein
MSNRLNELLTSARVPERSPGYWEHFPKRVVARLDDRSRLETAPTKLWWMAGLATACLVVVILLLRPQRETPTHYAKLYREVAGMFPNQVRAIVEDERGVHLELAEKPEVPTSPPLLVRICQPQRCRSVITFSGQRVSLDGDSVEVLADGRGKVLVVGEHSVIQPTEARAL